MKKRKAGTALVYFICILLTAAAFFAKDFVLYDFHMAASDYEYKETDQERPMQADSSVWFTYGSDREVQYGVSEGISADMLMLYAKTEEEAVPVSAEDLSPIREDLIGYVVAAAPAREQDVDGDGRIENVYDFARADFGAHTYELAPRAFHLQEIPFELAFEERKVIQVFYRGEPLVGGQVTVTAADGGQKVYTTEQHGWIDGLPIRNIREGFTVSYSPDGQNVYRMYYAVEDYDYFNEHFFRAQIPLLMILLLTVISILIVYFVREYFAGKDPAYAACSREKPGFGRGNKSGKGDSKFLLVRWLFLIFGFFLWTYSGKLLGQGQLFNQVAVPTFSCPFNLDQPIESSCYYLTHLPVLFLRGWEYVVIFLATLVLFLVFGGRILCGFMCPLGFIQDLFDQLRRALHIRPIPVTDRMNKVIQPLKWMWIILFLGFVFVGGDFCDICPNKVFSTAMGGWWVNYALGGFLAVPLLAGSFFIKRFWCLMCPMGYLLGVFHKFNLFKLKKDCTSCTECGACYNACPMRIKSIYTERGEVTPSGYPFMRKKTRDDKVNVQTVDCLMCGECIDKCPEDKALSMTFCGKAFYQSSRKTFMSKFARKQGAGKE